MNGDTGNQVSASKAIEYIQFRLAGVRMPPDHAKLKARTDTDQIIAHVRSRLSPLPDKRTVIGN
jgi:hypothetical protein